MEDLKTNDLIKMYKDYFNQWEKDKTIKDLSEFESIIIELTNREFITVKGAINQELTENEQSSSSFIC
tara:strand:- start:16849 stop:17052 length:204 start_codon:yes stop_codon:yes gene_type:complete